MNVVVDETTAGTDDCADEPVSVASMLASKFPELFKGAIYNCGVNFWDDATSGSVELIRNNRFVFITGSEDFNVRDTKRVFKKYKRAGVRQIKLMVIPHMGHSNPGRREYAQAIAYLDDIPVTVLSSED